MIFGVILMKSDYLYLEIIRNIHHLISGGSFRQRAVERREDFSRTRKMSFIDYMYAILQNSKTSMQVGLNAFFDTYKKGEIECTKQAFSKGRQRIKVEAFQELSQAVVENFYEKAELSHWNGYQLFGIDGTRLNLPCTKELAEIYGTQITHGAPQVQALVSCVYDLLHGIIVDACFAPCRSSERNAAMTMMANFHVKNANNPVFIMDRGYPSAELLNAIETNGHKFILRYSSKFLKNVQAQGDDVIVDHKFKKMNHTMRVRLLKIKLSDKENEYLITNIFDSNITLEDFKWAYRKRWGIETKYNDLKNKLEIENFSGYSPKAILQDFHATIFLANLAGVMQYDLHAEVEAAHANSENLYEYKMNVAMTISELKQTVVEMLVTSSRLKREKLYQKIIIRLTRSVVPVRHNRAEARIKRHKSMKFHNNLKKI